MMTNVAPVEIPIFKTNPKKDEVKQMGHIAGAIVEGQAWKAELTQVKITHGPMDVRLWRKVK